MWQWNTRGANCPTCNALRGRIYSYDMWMSVGLWPGFHINCNCYLSKIADGTPTSDPDFFGSDIALHLNGINLNLPGIGSLLQWNFNYQPFPYYSIKEIEEAHLRYGPDIPIGEAIKRMHEDDHDGYFFKRSNIWDEFLSWRILRTMQHYECIDDQYCGAQPIFPRWFREKILGRKTFDKREYWRKSARDRYIRVRSVLNDHLQPDELQPEFPYQSYHYGSR